MNTEWQNFSHHPAESKRIFFGECLFYFIKPNAIFLNAFDVGAADPLFEDIIQGVRNAKARLGAVTLNPVAVAGRSQIGLKLRSEAYGKLYGMVNARTSAWMIAYFEPNVRKGSKFKISRCNHAFDKVPVIYGKSAISLRERRAWMRSFQEGFINEFGETNFSEDDIVALRTFSKELVKRNQI